MQIIHFHQSGYNGSLRIRRFSNHFSQAYCPKATIFQTHSPSVLAPRRNTSPAGLCSNSVQQVPSSGEGTFMFRVIPWDRARMQSVCSDISMFGEHLFHSVFCTVLSTKGNSSQQGSLDVSVI